MVRACGWIGQCPHELAHRVVATPKQYFSGELHACAIMNFVQHAHRLDGITAVLDEARAKIAQDVTHMLLGNSRRRSLTEVPLCRGAVELV